MWRGTPEIAGFKFKIIKYRMIVETAKRIEISVSRFLLIIL
jgi:hypothetical protein